MNMLNNWKPGERLDVWLSRHAGMPPAPYFGFDQVSTPVTMEEVTGPYTVSSWFQCSLVAMCSWSAAVGSGLQ